MARPINSSTNRLNVLRFSVVTVVVAIIVWGLTDVRQRARIDPHNISVHKTDFTVYTEAGAAMFDGRDPYQVANPRGWKYVYPPLFAIVMAPLHTWDPQFQVILWFAISVCLCWGCYRECVPGQPAIGARYSLRPRSELARFGASFCGTMSGLALFLFFVPATLIGWGANLHHLDTWWNPVATHEENSLIENFAQDNTTD